MGTVTIQKTSKDIKKSWSMVFFIMTVGALWFGTHILLIKHGMVEKGPELFYPIGLLLFGCCYGVKTKIRQWWNHE